MPILVRCVQCSGQLRVADDLVGKRVRCPACNSIFTATAPVDPPPEPPKPEPEKPIPVSFDLDDMPVATEKVDPWKSLNLELTETDPKPAPAGADEDDIVPAEIIDVPTGGLYGAVEVGGTPSDPSTPTESDGADDRTPPRRPALELDEDDVPDLRRKVPERAVPPSEGGRLRRPERDDEEEDTVRCPECDRRVSRERSRCSFCDARLSRRGRDDDDDHDDRRGRRRRRRDGESHRGGTVLTLGIISLVVPFVCWCGWFMAGPVGVILGAIAWVMGGGDLRKMRDGVMDDEGEGSTRGGYICGILGVVFNLVLFLGCGSWTIYTVYEAERQQNRMNGNQRPNKAGGFQPPR